MKLKVENMRLTTIQIRQRAAEVPTWTVELTPRESIVLEWTGESFTQVFALMTQIAQLAEEMNHHPEWTNVFRRLKIRLSTHDVGGLSDLDFKMATRIDELIGALD